MNFETLFGPVRQWGFLVKDLDEAMHHWKDVLGVGPWWGFRNVSMETEFQGQVNEARMNVGLSYQNGVQIELIQQTNSVLSPYSGFMESDQQQVFHQIAYFVEDIDQAVKDGERAGLTVAGICRTPFQRIYYMGAPWLGDMVIELMEEDRGMTEHFEQCAEEAQNWQGDEPFRLISL
ncbi:VOC family protein [Endozoicomonas arenosclerae]|uniref:VOC family protein n=1 Tax=Endozoicomonas arenosclerae TaxID=1633495 RepID=UPI000781E80B|nr:VOC family protein [Endozoicomonas arenosclerae]